MDETPLNLNLAAIQQLESLLAAGVTCLPHPAESASQLTFEQPVSSVDSTPETAPTPQVAREDAREEPSLQQPAALPTPVAQPAASAGQDAPRHTISAAVTLDILQQQVAACTLCNELATTRTQTVFGIGNPSARLCILGEAPGADEDRLGEPFVGASGQLLNRILGACGLEREDVYILNILKCRPPGNRNPAPAESDNCRQFLIRQLQLIDPEFICCLGAVAAQNLLETTSSIGRLRGQLHDYRGIQVLCTYHPAYLLRNPSAKKDCWEDMKLLMREMGTPVD